MEVKVVWPFLFPSHINFSHDRIGYYISNKHTINFKGMPKVGIIRES